MNKKQKHFFFYLRTSCSVIITKFYFVPSIIVLKVQKNQLTKTVIERKQFCLDRPRQLLTHYTGKYDRKICG